jgi:hypothetical protein
MQRRRSVWSPGATVELRGEPSSNGRLCHQSSKRTGSPTHAYGGVAASAHRRRAFAAQVRLGASHRVHHIETAALSASFALSRSAGLDLGWGRLHHGLRCRRARAGRRPGSAI